MNALESTAISLAASPIDPAVAKSTVAADVPTKSFTLSTGAPAEDVAEEETTEEEAASREHAAAADDEAPATQSDDDSTDDDANASRPVATGLHPHRPGPNDYSAQRNRTSNGAVEAHTTDNKRGSDNGSPTDHAAAPHQSPGGRHRGSGGVRGERVIRSRDRVRWAVTSRGSCPACRHHRRGRYPPFRRVVSWVSRRRPATRTHLQRGADAATRTSRIRIFLGGGQACRGGRCCPPQRSHPSRPLRLLLPRPPFWSVCRARSRGHYPTRLLNNQQRCRLPFPKDERHIVAGFAAVSSLIQHVAGKSPGATRCLTDKSEIRPCDAVPHPAALRWLYSLVRSPRAGSPDVGEV